MKCSYSGSFMQILGDIRPIVFHNIIILRCLMNCVYFLVNPPTDSRQVWIDGPPHARAALPQTLTDGELQVQQRDSLQHQQD